MDKQQFENLNIDKSKLVLATGKVATHDAKLDTKPVGYFKDAMRRFVRNKASVAGAIIICFLMLFAIVGPWLTPYDFNYSNIEKANLLPYVKGLEWLGVDGCKKQELSEVYYWRYMAIGAETGINPIDELIEITEIQQGKNVKKQYVCKVNTYYQLGVVTKNLTKEEYLKLQEYQNATGIQIVYPAIDATFVSEINRYDVNYWYKTVYDEKSGKYTSRPDWKDGVEGQFQNAYVVYDGTDEYDSLRIEGETPLYNYVSKKASATGAYSYDVRVSEYRYDQYMNATVVVNEDGTKTYTPGREPEFWFGTNQYGEDLFVRLSSGARFSFLLAIFVSAINLTIGAIYGAIEGYYGGTVDMLMERFSDIVGSIPMYVVISLLKWHVGSSLKGGGGVLLSLVLAFFVTGWIGMAGSVRRQFYRFKNQEFVMAARTLGASDFRLMFKHIFPNSLGTLVTSCVLVIPGVIFSESSLSYLGIVNLDVGNFTSVGTMLSNGQAAGISSFPHVIFWPALFIALLEISFNLFGNGLRDAFNPSLRGSEG